MYVLYGLRSQQRMRWRATADIQRVVLFVRQLSGSVLAHRQERLQRNKGNSIWKVFQNIILMSVQNKKVSLEFNLLINENNKIRIQGTSERIL